MFDGTLGNYTGTEYKSQLLEQAQLYHAKPFPIAKVHEETLKTGVERLVNICVLKSKNNSEWAAPTFIIPKKNGRVHFISNFRELNIRIKRKPFPIPKIQHLLLKVEGFNYASCLDLNMDYYHIKLCPFSRILPWGKYEYQKLPTGLCNSPDIFQDNMNELCDARHYVRISIDDLLIISNKSLDDHIKKLDKVLNKLKSVSLKDELEYLGFKISRGRHNAFTR